jgi:hypothetical protein
MNSVQTKIQEILEASRNVPYIFKEVIEKKSFISQDEEIVDLVFLEREYQIASDKTSKLVFKGRLLIATSHGIIFMEEGLSEIATDYLGYRIKHISYNKLESVELDICLLQGILLLGTSGHNMTKVQFNTTKDFRKFEQFVNTVRGKMLQTV